MDDLIEALTIMRKYGNPTFPTNCSHDELVVCIQPSDVSKEDLARLEALHFEPNDNDCFMSSWFGSA